MKKLKQQYTSAAATVSRSVANKVLEHPTAVVVMLGWVVVATVVDIGVEVYRRTDGFTTRRPR